MTETDVAVWARTIAVLILLSLLGCDSLIAQASRTSGDAIDEVMRTAHCVKVHRPLTPPGPLSLTLGRC